MTILHGRYRKGKVGRGIARAISGKLAKAGPTRVKINTGAAPVTKVKKPKKSLSHFKAELARGVALQNAARPKFKSTGRALRYVGARIGQKVGQAVRSFNQTRLGRML